jgi:peptidoglycan/LPS O-acetylase OafA/YrhL
LAPNYTATTFVGNLAFLQTIAVPIFGTNGPMWSLANEFWYYLIFPLAASLTLLLTAGLADCFRCRRRHFYSALGNAGTRIDLDRRGRGSVAV